jgi:hypothetical protein
MNDDPDVPYVTSESLPPYRGILAVDARGFTDLPGRLHQTISGLIPQLVERALTNVQLAEVWNEPAFFGPTGDGFAMGVPTSVLPFLLHPFLPELQQVLARHNANAGPGHARIQLRVSINVGPVKDGPNLYVSGNGTPRNDTHRLLDSVPVKAILSAASPSVTFVAAIISDRVYQDVVLPGYAGVHPDRLIEVPATVEGKNFSQRAWLYVPEPSGSLGAVPALRPVEPRSGPGGKATPAASSTQINAPDNKGNVTGTVEGDMSVEFGRQP